MVLAIDKLSLLDPHHRQTHPCRVAHHIRAVCSWRLRRLVVASNVVDAWPDLRDIVGLGRLPHRARLAHPFSSPRQAHLWPQRRRAGSSLPCQPSDLEAGLSSCGGERAAVIVLPVLWLAPRSCAATPWRGHATGDEAQGMPLGQSRCRVPRSLRRVCAVQRALVQPGAGPLEGRAPALRVPILLAPHLPLRIGRRRLRVLHLRETDMGFLLACHRLGALRPGRSLHLVAPALRARGAASGDG